VVPNLFSLYALPQRLGQYGKFFEKKKKEKTERQRFLFRTLGSELNFLGANVEKRSLHKTSRRENKDK
jgi:hypothetical protein